MAEQKKVERKLVGGITLQDPAHAPAWKEKIAKDSPGAMIEEEGDTLLIYKEDTKDTKKK